MRQNTVSMHFEVRILFLLYYSALAEIALICFLSAVDLFGSTPFATSPVTPPVPNRSVPLQQTIAVVPVMSPVPVFSPGAIVSPFHDPFGMQVFSPTATPVDVDQQSMDRELMDMQVIWCRLRQYVVPIFVWFKFCINNMFILPVCYNEYCLKLCLSCHETGRLNKVFQSGQN